MPITMKELARVAGVSRATVDRALNQRGRVNKETANRIQILAKSMNYEPNVAAKSLAVRHKDLKIGFIINRKGNDYFEDVLLGVNAAAKEISTFGISVNIQYASSGFEVNNQLELIDEMIKREYNAIAITPINDKQISAKLNDAIAKGIAVVAVTADIQTVDYLAYIGCNHEKAGRIAANIARLICNEKARIVVVIGSKKMLGHSKRLKGFQDNICSCSPDMTIVSIIENSDDDDVSYEMISNLLKQDSTIDFLFFATAGTVGGIRAVIDQNQQSNIKIVSFDLTAGSKYYLEQGIIEAVICQDPYNQGYSAIKVLSDYLLSNFKPKNNHIFSNASIILKESLSE